LHTNVFYIRKKVLNIAVKYVKLKLENYKIIIKKLNNTNNIKQLKLNISF